MADDDRETIRLLLHHYAHTLTEWEETFLQDLREKIDLYGLSDRQRAKLDEIWRAKTQDGADGGTSATLNRRR
jgi:hypothetical protein